MLDAPDFRFDPDPMHELVEPEGIHDWRLESEIADAVARIRDSYRRPSFGIRATNRSEIEVIRDYFADLLRPYGLRVSRMPMWKGPNVVHG